MLDMFVPLLVAAVLLIGGIIALCIFLPDVGRVLARIFAVLALGGGVAGLIAGLLFFNFPSEAEYLRGGPPPFALIAIGAGFMTSLGKQEALSFWHLPEGMSKWQLHSGSKSELIPADRQQRDFG